MGISSSNAIVKGYSYLTHADAQEIVKQVEREHCRQHPEFMCETGDWRSFSLEPLPALMTDFEGVPRDKCRIITHRGTGEQLVAKLYEPMDCDFFCRRVYDGLEGTILGTLPPIAVVDVDIDAHQDIDDEFNKLVGQKVKSLLAAKDAERAKMAGVAIRVQTLADGTVSTAILDTTRH